MQHCHMPSFQSSGTFFFFSFFSFFKFLQGQAIQEDADLDSLLDSLFRRKRALSPQNDRNKYCITENIQNKACKTDYIQFIIY